MGPLRKVLRILREDGFPVATELDGCKHTLPFGATTSSAVREKIQARHCTACPPEEPKPRAPRGSGARRPRRPRGEGAGLEGGGGIPRPTVGWGIEELLRPAAPRAADRRPPMRVIEVGEADQQALEAAVQLFSTADGTVERQLVMEALERGLTRAGRLRLAAEVDRLEVRAASRGRRR